MTGSLTRRELIGAGMIAGAGLAMPRIGPSALIERALAVAPPTCARLSDIEHVVILVQENRSFDSYFGSFRGVQGYADPAAPRLNDGSGRAVFAQPGYPAPGFGGHLYPFHLDTAANGECVNDITHDWGPQHRSWNGGAQDGFVSEHVRSEGADRGAITMGYHRRGDLPFYYALADAFTICDRYHCSVLGPTDPNQLYLVSATLDPAGRSGGPLLETLSSTRTQAYGTFSWTTMPEQLQGRGVSWKVYSGDNTSPTEDSPFPFFRQYHERPELAAKGLAPTFPGDFQADAAAGVLPQVSWVYATIAQSEHPPAPVTYGEHTTRLVLDALLADPARWAKTALFVTWDENGGFFDHVRPPTPGPGEPGEYVSVRPLPPAAQGIAAPIGLGFRVPLLVVSPFSRGGFVSSQTFDHTSLLRFLEARFGAEVPNLSPWRRSVTGDLVSAFNFAAPDESVPSLPRPSLTDPRVTSANCTTAPATLAPGGGSVLAPYAVPPNSMPAQEPGSSRRPSGAVCGPSPHSPATGGRSDSPSGLRISVRRRHGRCRRHRIRVVVNVTHTSPLRWIHIHLDGRRIAVRHAARFSLTLHVRGNHGHRHRLTVTARDVTGAGARRTLHVLPCATRR